MRCKTCGNKQDFDPLASDETQVHKGNVFCRDRDGHPLYVLYCPYCGKRVRE